MSLIIKKLSIKNWKSFEQTDFCFEAINVFIGKNSAGKTNLGNAIRLLFRKGLDFGSGGREINQSDFHNPETDILIEAEINIDGNVCKPWLKIDAKSFNKSIGEDNNKVFGSFFPSGVKRVLHEIGIQQAFDFNNDENIQVAQKKWHIIRSEFEKFTEYKISEKPPVDKQRFLSDTIVTSVSPQIPVTELGSGYVQALYFIFEITKQEETCKIFLFEEPENHMHIDLQRKFLKYLLTLSLEKQMQFFVTTHSSVFIDASILSPMNSVVYQIKKDSSSSESFLQDSNQSKWNLLTEELGYKPSDLLLSNTIIWVEGPSDIIYLRYWLSKWMDEFTDKNSHVKEGRDYTFMFYGGRLLSNLAFEKEETTMDEIHEFIDLCLINRNVALVMDSDIINGNNGLVNFDSDLAEYKKTIRDRFENKGAFLWITKCKEIENYLDEETFKTLNHEIHCVPKNKCHYGQYEKITDLKRYFPKNKKKFKKKAFATAATNYAVEFSKWNLQDEIKGLYNWVRSKSL